MKKNSLTINKGLSLSQGQSISNLCNQRALEIENKLSVINNYTETVKVEGSDLEIIKAVKMPDNVIELIEEKAKLHACQAFLMENIKAKDTMLNRIKMARPIIDIKHPEKPETKYPEEIDLIDDNWGWEQLTAKELAEYYEVEAFAAHIGQFIHKGGKLSTLRKELVDLPAVRWMEIQTGVKSPVNIKAHHTPEVLHKIHEDLAAIHRKHEQRVNYFKAKVKNLVTKENARTAKLNKIAQSDVDKINADNGVEYEKEFKLAADKINLAEKEFEIARHDEIGKIASMRIGIDDRYQDTIDMFLKELKTEENTEE
jgi:hypothetical protein